MLGVDMFAGGGGASEGYFMATGRHPDIAVNHDPIAIAMHKLNHPGTRHYEENVWKVPPRRAVGANEVGLLWGSPDCTHFSRAKGGPIKRDADIRSLAWAIERFARETNPRVIELENVGEFRDWGPLDSEGNVIKSQTSTTFRAFIRRIKRLGYNVQYKEMQACDYGSPTSRTRLFLVARRDGKPIIWPEHSHGPGLTPYRTAGEIIDWSIPCPSIFERKKPLVDNTLRRIAEGLRRYVINNAEPFIVTYYGPKKGEKFRGLGMGNVLPTQTTENRFGLVVPHIHRQYGKGVGHNISQPLATTTAGGGGKSALVNAYLEKYSLGKPISANHAGEVAFLIKYYSNGGQWQGLKNPMHTITTADRMGLVTVMVEGEPYVVTDIGFRMLSPRELFRAQGFRDDYVIDFEVDGWKVTKKAQVKLVGNSVCPQNAAALIRANCDFMINNNQRLLRAS